MVKSDISEELVTSIQKRQCKKPLLWLRNSIRNMPIFPIDGVSWGKIAYGRQRKGLSLTGEMGTIWFF
jgi:hypothetical protein